MRSVKNWIVTATILVVCSCEEGYGADEVFRCPDRFIAGEVNTLTLKVNKTSIYAAQCSLPPTVLKFSRARASDASNAPTENMCQTAFSCVKSGALADPDSGSENECGCVKQSQDILTFEMKFIPSKEIDEGANFSYQLCVKPTMRNLIKNKKSCTLMSVVGKNDEDGGCETACIALIVVGSILVVTVAGFAVLCFAKKRGIWDGRIPVPT